MSSRPVTAWSLASPWGSAPRSILRGLDAQRPGASVASDTEPFLGPSVVAALGIAAQRWGGGRVGAIYGTRSPQCTRGPWAQTCIQGPAYALSMVSSPGHVLHSGLALLQNDLADAVLLASLDTTVRSSLLIERHGDSDARLWSTARPRPGVTFRLGAAPAAEASEVALPGAGSDALGVVTLALACLRTGLDPCGRDAEPDRICVASAPGDSFTVEVTP